MRELQDIKNVSLQNLLAFVAWCLAGQDKNQRDCAGLQEMQQKNSK